MADEGSLITDALRATIGVRSKPTINEVDKLQIRLFARSVGHVDPIYYDEAEAKKAGFRSLPCPPGYLGTAQFNPNTQRARTGRPRQGGLDGGIERQYTGVEICAGDPLTSVTKVVSSTERPSRLGVLIITRRETTFTNQNGELVCRAYGNILEY